MICRIYPSYWRRMVVQRNLSPVTRNTGRRKSQRPISPPSQKSIFISLPFKGGQKDGRIQWPLRHAFTRALCFLFSSAAQHETDASWIQARQNLLSGCLLICLPFQHACGRNPKYQGTNVCEDKLSKIWPPPAVCRSSCHSPSWAWIVQAAGMCNQSRFIC